MANVIRLYDGDDPREVPNYSIAEVASYLSVPRSTVRAWARGMGEFKPVIRLPEQGAALSFINVVEVHVLDALRRAGPRLPTIRKAVATLERELKTKHPLATELFLTDGVGIFVERLGKLIDISHAGQVAMREVLSDHLKRIDYGKDGLALRLYPFTRRGILDDPRSVVIDPAVSFGRPVLAHTGVPTEEIAERFNAGDTMEDLARDFRVTRQQIEEAIRCELHARIAA